MNKLSKTTNWVLDAILSEEAFCFYAVSCMILMPLAEFISELMGHVFVTQPIIFSIYGIAGMFIVALKFTFRPSKKHWSDIFFFTLLIFMFLSLIYSKDIARAVRNSDTTEYPAYFLAYYFLMFAGFQISKNKLRNIVLYTFIGLSFLEGILGVFQITGHVIMPPYHQPERYLDQAFALTQNPNNFGELCVLFVGACVGAFLFSKTIKGKIIFGILSLFALFSAYESFSRLSWLGVFAVFVFDLIMVAVMHRKHKDNKMYKNNLRLLAIGAVVLVVSAGIFVAFNDFAQTKILNSINEIKGAFNGDFDHFASSRGYIWRFAWESVPKNWVIGVGLDNLHWCFASSGKWIEAMYYNNRAHNVYLHILATQGVFALINYLALITIAQVKAVKRIVNNSDEEDVKLTWIFLSMFIGYCVAAFFSVRAFNVELYFCVTMGVMVPRLQNSNVKEAA